MIFTSPDAWTGGSFELLIYLGKKDTQEIRNILSILWSYQPVEGCWLDADTELDKQLRVKATEWDIESKNVLRGVATLPNHKKCACDSMVIIDDDGTWIYFGLPLGSLGEAYEIGAYPFEDGIDCSWIDPVSEWLAQLGRHIFEQAKFISGMTGFLTTREVDEVLYIPKESIPELRWNGYLRNENGLLSWYPPNAPSAPATLGKPI